MSASLPDVIRAHVAEVGGCPTILLHPDDYERLWYDGDWLALGALGRSRAAVFHRDDRVPRGCYRIERDQWRRPAA